MAAQKNGSDEQIQDRPAGGLLKKTGAPGGDESSAHASKEARF
jgi:hypothetical protein